LTVAETRWHGGSPGLQDDEPLCCASDWPKNKLAYGKPDIVDLAAAYAFGIVKTVRSMTATSARPWLPR
jgi:death-on-curing protein